MKSTPEHVEINKSNPLKISIFEEVKLKYPFHYHVNEYELTLTLGSRGVRLVGDHISEFDNIDLVLIGPGIPHCWLNNFSELNRQPENIMVVVIHFNPHLFTEELLNRTELQLVRDLLENSKRGVQFTGEIREKIKNKIMSLNIEQDFSTLIDLFSIFNDLSMTQEYELMCSPSYRFEGKKEENDKFENVYDYILRNFKEKIMISEVAEIADMNDSAFSHYFKKRTSKSFTDFLNELRLNYAANQITYTSRNIAEICYDSGFNNLSNFNRIFKKWRGITPNQWRKRTKPVIG